MADIQSNFAQSDAYLSALIREVRSVPPTSASVTVGRRTFFKLAGAGVAMGTDNAGDALTPS